MKNYFLVLILLGTITIPLAGSLFSQVINLTLSSTTDSYVSSGSTSVNYGTTNELFAGRYPNRTIPGQPLTYHTRRSFVYFSDIDAIPDNAIILSARLKIYAAAAKVGSPDFYLRRNTSSWIESGTGSITYSNQPTYETFDDITFSGTGATGYILIDVKSHVEKMVAGVYDNYGWAIHVDNESYSSGSRYQEFDPREQGSSYEPKVEISYYIPMSVTDAVISHQSLNGSDDGSISPTLQDGPGGTYSYQWFDESGSMTGKTSLNLTGVPCGWYGLRVTSNVVGSVPFYYSFLVGKDCSICEFEYNPGPNFMDEAMLYKTTGSQSTINYSGVDCPYFEASNIVGAGSKDKRTLLRYRLWVDPLLSLDRADLELTPYAMGNNSGGSSNESKFYHVTSDWQEGIVTYSISPSIGSHIVFPNSTSLSLKTVDVIPYFEQCQVSLNTTNFGWLLRPTAWQLISYQQYYSGNNGTSSNRPKVQFTLRLSNPEAPDYCNQIFAKLERTLRGVKYKPYLDHLYFYYDEEYATADAELNYAVYVDSDPINPVLDGGAISLNSIEYGDNRYTLDISSLAAGTYVLKVINDKKETFYLRFQIID